MGTRILALGIVAISIASGLPQASQADERQPNILWIVTDDQRPDSIGAYNRAVSGSHNSPLGYVESPAADRLAAEGTLFINAFNNAPACGPSRGSFHAGRYPFRHGHYAFELTHQAPDFVRPVVSQTLRDMGYTTASFGKADSYIYRWGPGQGFHDPGHWDHRIHFKNQLQKQGFGDLFGNTAYTKDWKKLGQAEWAHYPDGRVKEYFLQRVDGPITEQDKAIRAEVEAEFDVLRSYTRFNRNLIIGGVNPMPAEKTVDARVVDEFKNHLANADRDYQTVWGMDVTGPDSSKPLLMHLGFHLPHTPVLPPRSVRERFKVQAYDVPKFDKDVEVAKLPPQLRQLYNAMKADEMTAEETQQAIQDYYAFCAHGDALMGEAIDAFKSYSETQGRPWLIVFMIGDHGWHLGEQGIMAKFGPWRQSVANAIILASSDKSQVPAGQIYNGLVEYVDLSPTLIDAAEGDPTDTTRFDYLDGYSLMDVLEERQPKRDYVLGEMSLVIGHRAYMHSERFRFSMRTRPDGAAKGERIGEDITWALDAPIDQVDLALYDLKHDPMERNNVANDPAYRGLAGFFRDKLGRIVLGDGRIECDWSQANTYIVSDFAAGADDKKLEIPADLLPD